MICCRVEVWWEGVDSPSHEYTRYTVFATEQDYLNYDWAPADFGVPNPDQCAWDVTSYRVDFCDLPGWVQEWVETHGIPNGAIPDATQPEKMKVGHTSVVFPGIRWFMFLDGGFKGCRTLFPRKRYIRIALVSASDYKKNPAIADRYISRDLPQEVQGVLSEDKRGYFLYRGTLGTLVKKLAPHGVVYVGEM